MTCYARGMRIIAFLAFVFAGCGDNIIEPDAGLPSCATVCNPNDGPVSCDPTTDACHCPSPDGRPVFVDCTP